MRADRTPIGEASDLCQGLLKIQKKKLKVLAEFIFCIIFALALTVKANDGPFVYRLGRQVFILVRGVRFPYGLQVKLQRH